MQVYAVTCERDRDCGLAMQALSPQLRLLVFWLTKSVEQPHTFPSLLMLVFTFCVCSPHRLVQTQWRISLRFFFFPSTVGLCWHVVMLQECVDLHSESFKSPTMANLWKFSPQEYIFTGGNTKKRSNVCPWAGNEKYWLKAFLLHSQKQRLGLESHELSVKSVFPLFAKVIADNGALIDWTDQRQKEPCL